MLVRDSVADSGRAYLRRLGRGGEATTAEIAQAIGVDRAAVIAALMPLHGKGVTSRGKNAADGSAVVWRLQGDAS